MNFYISDLHIGHANVIKFDNRPFESTDEMKHVLFDNWNRVVRPEDTVYVLGDFFWKTVKNWPAMLKELSGHKILVRGNHDPMDLRSHQAASFNEICDYMEIVDGNRHVILCHYPIIFHKRDYDPSYWMLYGHVHTTRENTYVETIRKELKAQYVPNTGRPCGNLINVGCMMPWMNYTPKTLDEIIEGDKMAHAIPTRTFGTIR